MSLINDALKRATQVQPATAAPAPTAQPMEPAPPHRAVGIPSYFTPVFLFVICGAFWFMFKGLDAARKPSVLAQALNPAPVTVQAREMAPAGEPQDLPPTAGAELPIPVDRQFALNDAPTPLPKEGSEPFIPQIATKSKSIVGNDGALPVSARELSTPTHFKLQGIFYRPNSSSAVINSKTVSVGDTIDTATVRSITQRSVTLDLGSETKVLTLR